MDEGLKIRERRQATPLIAFPSSTPNFIPGKAQVVLITATPPIQANLLNSYVRLGCFKQGSQPEAQCTITDAAVAIGANLVVQRNNKTFGYDFTSLQMNWALFDFGKITRAATQLSNPSANTLVFSVTVRMADSRDAADGTNISLMVEYAFGSYQSSVKTDLKLAVDSSAEVKLTYGLFSDILEFFPGDKIKLTFSDNSVNPGIVECTSTEVFLYFPEWLQNVQFVLPGDGFYGTTFNLIANTDTMVHYSAGAFYFGQTFKIKITGQVAATVILPYQSLLLNVQIGLEVRCTHYVHNASVPAGTTEVDRTIQFQWGVIHSKLGQYSVLGLGDPAQIRDCQITASMVAYPQYGPLNIRFQNGTGWLSGFRTSDLQHHNYLTIVLGQLTTLYSVRMTGTNTMDHRFLDLYASLDGITYEYIRQVIVVATRRLNGSTAIRNPVEARAFRFVDQTFKHTEAPAPFTMELVGKANVNDPHSFGKFVTSE
ncbi:hypothetical protein EG68_09240 [Paragonimus skrjabini miyazakii]|uniref:F5/8 type C domain-containing protein n=1 Tax=Paragonimus skrjabini miyazakii TaxID=59628 RepID=A0A8S9YS26_9TREM|nr:hypothetical protein EG68_09240 [Paragonimus skrjabini miyazakii]